MSKPTALPLWDVTEVNSVDPGSTREQEGWLAPAGVPEKPPFENFNFWQNLVYKWIKHFDENPAFPDNTINGLVPSNSVDSDHDITLSAGKCLDSTNTKILTLSAALTKQIDAAWAEGTNAGGLFAGSVSADTDYYFFLIEKDSDGTIDAGWDTSPIAANRPSGWSAYRMVHWDQTDGSANIKNFTAFESASGALEVEWKATQADYVSISSTTARVEYVLSAMPNSTVKGVLVGLGAKKWIRSTSFTDSVPSSTNEDSDSDIITGFSVQADANSKIAIRSLSSETISILTNGYVNERM